MIWFQHTLDHYPTYCDEVIFCLPPTQHSDKVIFYLKRYEDNFVANHGIFMKGTCPQECKFKWINGFKSDCKISHFKNVIKTWGKIIYGLVDLYCKIWPLFGSLNLVLFNCLGKEFPSQLKNNPNIAEANLKFNW